MGDPGALCHEAADHIHLILHQGNQRGDDDGCAWHYQSRELEAHGLASAGRHQHKGVLPGQKIKDNLFLVALEGIVSEEFLQLGSQKFGIGLHRVNFFFPKYSLSFPDIQTILSLLSRISQ